MFTAIFYPLPFFFFNDPATTEIYTLSLHDALPISHSRAEWRGAQGRPLGGCGHGDGSGWPAERPAPPPARGHDWRNLAFGRGAAGGWDQGKGARRQARRHPRGYPTGGQ